MKTILFNFRPSGRYILSDNKNNKKQEFLKLQIFSVFVVSTWGGGEAVDGTELDEDEDHGDEEGGEVAQGEGVPHAVEAEEGRQDE